MANPYLDPDNKSLYAAYVPNGMPYGTYKRWMKEVSRLEGERQTDDKEFRTYFPPRWLIPTQEEIDEHQKIVDLIAEKKKAFPKLSVEEVIEMFVEENIE